MKIEGHRKARWYMGVGKGKVVEMIPIDYAKMEDFRKITAGVGSSQNSSDPWVLHCFGNWQKDNIYCYQCFCKIRCECKTMKRGWT